MIAAPIPEQAMEPEQDPIDLLIVIEEASHAPIRPEYVEGMAVVPPQPDETHNHGAAELYYQLRVAGIHLAGFNSGYRAAHKDGSTMALVIPDFYVRRRRASELDKAYYKAHKGWYPIDMLALIGEVTSMNHETDTGPKLRTYAAAGVPVYVLINRHTRTAHCYTEPILPSEDPTTAYYGTESKIHLGEPLPLPAPYPTLDTTPFLES